MGLDFWDFAKDVPFIDLLWKNVADRVLSEDLPLVVVWPVSLSPLSSGHFSFVVRRTAKCWWEKCLFGMWVFLEPGKFIQIFSKVGCGLRWKQIFYAHLPPI